jgi:uncharacterized membrane protein
MLQLPPVPGWEGLHPLIVHFPIALLFAAPLFVLIGAVLGPRRGRPMLYSALLLMGLGAASIFVAVETGEAAGKLAERTPEINAMIEHHEALAERTRLTFSILTVVFAAILAAPLLRRRSPERVTTTVLPLVFLLAYGAGMILLANTADHGGRLVHELGVHALIPAAPAEAQLNQATPEHGE